MRAGRVSPPPGRPAALPRERGPGWGAPGPREPGVEGPQHCAGGRGGREGEKTPRGAIPASAGRGQRQASGPRARRPRFGTFSGPDRGAQNSSPGWGVGAVSLGFPRSPHPGARTPGRGSAGPGLARAVSPLPQIRVQARAGRAGAHGAATPPDPGLGAPREAPGGRGRRSSPTRTSGPAASARPGAARETWTRRLGSMQPGLTESWTESRWSPRHRWGS
ncbi:Hypothetical predicted protein [Marmota monax]|uniref:Uncharacterized protein n=1 Tax=Marmota monax TaxID=9995 RepID=A0A5E4BGT3_MARMO|nr:hypothetical protein GHT09_013750 [Marmota monax]VTJ68913.1 Hypothetical predicted protein [Marmota monax]